MVESTTAIRAELKTMGISSRKVSVKNESYAGGSSIYITIKDPDIRKATVKEIANKYYDKYTFVHVSYSSNCIDSFIAYWLPSVKSIIWNLRSETSGTLLPIPTTDYMIGFAQYGYPHLTLWGGDDYATSCISPEGLAECLGERVGYNK
jgi:hypothetical protein